MKRNVRIITLAAALCLCLLLTGCYQAPDDVNNSGNNGGSGNNLPFQTLQPVATAVVTPDTVVVTSPEPNQNQGQGQSIFPETSTQPSVTDAGGNTWNNYGVPGAENTPLSTGSTIVFNTPATGAESTIQIVTSAPTIAVPTTPAPVTPTPTPLTMRLGFQGEAVRTVQRRLKELGYYTGSIDGDFGEATDKALKEFQKANGLTPDGKVGEQTKNKLNDKNAKTYKQAHATPTPKVTAKPTTKPTPTPNLSRDYYLRLGDSGKRVETLQRRLIELGWLSGKVTGNFDGATDQALRAFQTATKALYTDGVAGPETLQILYSTKAARSTKPAATNDAETLEFGSKGAEVTKLQQKLKELGYLSGAVDGDFGVGTQAAVIAFQKNNNLTADGRAGTATQNKLYSGTANKATGTAAKIKNAGGRDTQGIASTGFETLEIDTDNNVNAVKRLQDRLRALGYNPGYSDGKYGTTTEAAVMAFQSNNNLVVDGKAGPATQRKLYGTGAKSPSDYSKLQFGDQNDAVKNLQYTLYELGYYDGAIDGKFGQTTMDAVRSFQIENKLNVDGIAGQQTLSVLYSSAAVPATQGSTDPIRVQKGDSGDIVFQIQDLLSSEYGLLPEGYADGYYDETTESAVKVFQANNGLTVDGICGPETLQVLFGY